MEDKFMELEGGDPTASYLACPEYCCLYLGKEFAGRCCRGLLTDSVAALFIPILADKFWHFMRNEQHQPAVECSQKYTG